MHFLWHKCSKPNWTMYVEVFWTNACLMVVVVVTVEFFDEEQGVFFVDLPCLPKMPGNVYHLDLKLTEEIFGRAWWGAHGIWHPWTPSALPVCFLCCYPAVVSFVRSCFQWEWPSSQEEWRSLIKGVHRTLWIHQGAQTMLCCFVLPTF